MSKHKFDLLAIVILNRIIDYIPTTCNELVDLRLVSQIFNDTICWYLYPETIKRIITYQQFQNSIRFDAWHVTFTLFKFDPTSTISFDERFDYTNYRNQRSNQAPIVTVNHKITINDVLYRVCIYGHHQFIEPLIKWGYQLQAQNLIVFDNC